MRFDYVKNQKAFVYSVNAGTLMSNSKPVAIISESKEDNGTIDYGDIHNVATLAYNKFFAPLKYGMQEVSWYVKVDGKLFLAVMDIEFGRYQDVTLVIHPTQPIINEFL